jgi:hypothetical protein
MAKARPLLERLLNAPDLAKIVPHLQPDVLHRVIQNVGLEECGEFVALATPEQISQVMDLDLWRVRTKGGDETLDAERFGVWVEALMESGAAAAAHKVIALDIELITAGIARHAAVFDHAAVASYTTLDGEVVPGRELKGDLERRIGGYVIDAKSTAAWDAIVELLGFLATDHPDYFHRLMRGCVRLSSGTREADGFHDLLQDVEQDTFDLSADRDARREKQGYVTPAEARAFLQTGRQLKMKGEPPPRSAVAAAYFRAIAAERPNDHPPTRRGAATLDESDTAAPEIDPEAAAAVFEILRDAGVITTPARGLLESGDPQTSPLAWVQAHVESHPASAEELAFLANTLLAGCSIQSRAFTLQEASDAAAATCNLGLENWPFDSRAAGLAQGNEHRDLITAFQVGWTILHRDVCMFTAKQLIEVLVDVSCSDRDIQLQLNTLRRELKRHVRDRAPWRAQHALDVIMVLDAPSWAALLALLAECPVVHAAVGASRRNGRSINATDFVFITRNSQIAAVRDFLESLPSALTL